MTLPEKSEKEYPKLTAAGRWAFIEGEPRHIAELEALFQQRGIPYTLAPAPSGCDVLVLAADADRAAGQQVLDDYKAAKGS